MLNTYTHASLVSTAPLSDFWEGELELFGLENRIRSEVVRNLCALQRSVSLKYGEWYFHPHIITEHAVKVYEEQAEFNACPPWLTDKAVSLSDKVERHALAAGTYWLAVTGIARGEVGVNDGVGEWFLHVAQEYAEQDDKKIYSELRRLFSPIREHIECRVRGNNREFLSRINQGN